MSFCTVPASLQPAEPTCELAALTAVRTSASLPELPNLRPRSNASASDYDNHAARIAASGPIFNALREPSARIIPSLCTVSALGITPSISAEA